MKNDELTNKELGTILENHQAVLEIVMRRTRIHDETVKWMEIMLDNHAKRIQYLEDERKP
jgi:hypothetical protein